MAKLEARRAEDAYLNLDEIAPEVPLHKDVLDALESEIRAAGQNESEHQPHDELGPRKPSLRKQKRSRSRKRSKRAHFAEENPEPRELN